MDLIDLFTLDTLDKATENPFILTGALVALLLWLVGFSRRKILQDLEILERLEKIDPENQARPAVRSSIGLWVSFTYGWPLAGSVACFALAVLLFFIAVVSAWAAWNSHSSATAIAAGIALLESAAFAFLGWLQVRRLQQAHFASLMKWKP